MICVVAKMPFPKKFSISVCHFVLWQQPHNTTQRNAKVNPTGTIHTNFDDSVKQNWCVELPFVAGGTVCGVNHSIPRKKKTFDNYTRTLINFANKNATQPIKTFDVVGRLICVEIYFRFSVSTNKDVNQRNCEQSVIFSGPAISLVYYSFVRFYGWNVRCKRAKCSQWILLMTHKSNDMWTHHITSHLIHEPYILITWFGNCYVFGVRRVLRSSSISTVLFFVGGFRFGTHEAFKLFYSILFFFCLIIAWIGRSFSENWLGSFSFIVATYMCFVVCLECSRTRASARAHACSRNRVYICTCVCMYDNWNERSVKRFNLIIRNCFWSIGNLLNDFQHRCA